MNIEFVVSMSITPVMVANHVVKMNSKWAPKIPHVLNVIHKIMYQTQTDRNMNGYVSKQSN